MTSWAESLPSTGSGRRCRGWRRPRLAPGWAARPAGPGQPPEPPARIRGPRHSRQSVVDGERRSWLTRQVIALLAAEGQRVAQRLLRPPPSDRAARTRPPRPRARTPWRAGRGHRRTGGRARTALRPRDGRRVPAERRAASGAWRSTAWVSRRPRRGGRAAPGQRRRAPRAGPAAGVQLGLAVRRDRRLDRHPGQLVPEAQVGPVGNEDPGGQALLGMADPAPRPMTACDSRAGSPACRSPPRTPPPGG